MITMIVPDNPNYRKKYKNESNIGIHLKKTIYPCSCCHANQSSSILSISPISMLFVALSRRRKKREKENRLGSIYRLKSPKPKK